MAGHPHHSPTDLKGFRRQQCSVCRCEEKFNFHIPDHLWKQIVPEEYQQRVVWLALITLLAKKMSTTRILLKIFISPGDKATVKFEVESAEDVGLYR